jgi:hypothetical protein
MDDAPNLASGFVRIAIGLRPKHGYTPGEIANASGLKPEDIGHVVIGETEAIIDVRSACGMQARDGLARVGRTQLAARNWQWLRLSVGRNHGLSMGQLRKIMQKADALPLGRISIQNTHTLVGLHDDKVVGVVSRLSTLKINGFAAKATFLPLGIGPGSAAYVPSSKS